MKRKAEERIADAIIISDIEFRMFTPTCRIDNYWETFKKKWKWFQRLHKKHNRCPILDGGDLFDKRYKTNPNHELLKWVGENLPQPFYTVPGNHDLPGKSYANYPNSAMAVLEMAERLEHLSNGHCLPVFATNQKELHVYGFEWGYDFKNLKYVDFGNDIKIAIIHTMVYEEFEPYPGCEGYSAKELMHLLPEFDLIITGHNHQTFVRKEGNRVLVNPGSFMRNDADQVDHRPCVFLWYAKTNTIKKVFVPIEDGVINRDYIDDKAEKEDRLDAFVSKLGEQTVQGINFLENLEKVVDTGSVSTQVKNKVWQYYEGI